MLSFSKTTTGTVLFALDIVLILAVCMWRPNGILSLLEEGIRRRRGKVTP